MNILLNGTPVQTDIRVLAAFLDHHFSALKVAVAINGAFVPRNLFVSTPIQEGDRLEVLTPMQGG